MKDSSPILHYCQKCLAANTLGQEFCDRCGTRLMIIVEPSSSRYEVGDETISTDEHLLERVSALENKFSRLSDRVEQCLDLLLRNAQNAYFDRSLVKSLIQILADDGLVQTSRLEKLWNTTCQQDVETQQESVKRDQLRLDILARFKGATRPAFEELVNEGFLLIDDSQIERGINALRRASEIGTGIQSLEIFIGEHYFRKGRIKLAREHLTRAHDLLPDDTRIALLLGLTCADDGDLQMAKELLGVAAERNKASFAAHYGLGRLFVAENNLKKALAEFKRALTTRPSPEAHYVLACLYYQLERDSLALRHLQKAIDLDQGYREAFYLLALIHGRNGEKKLSRAAFRKSRLNETPSTSQRSLAGQGVAPLFDLQRTRSRRLMTGVDKRLARALREDALRES